MRFEWEMGRPLVMGILNITPDSFSDGGKFHSTEAAVARAREMISQGADILDIGGESTRPGAAPVSLEEELARVEPVVTAVAKLEGGPLISVDTTKARVAEAAIQAGARIINDISALRFDPRMVEVAASSGAGLVLMHMQGEPATMQRNPTYRAVVSEVRDFLGERVAWAEARGVKKSQIAVDPGIGFGKSVEHNLQLLAELEQLRDLGCPILVGVSRKSFLGKLSGRETADRLTGSLAAAGWALANGANIIRAHDVAETAEVARLVGRLQQQRHK